jgi:proteasome beta subunit
MLDLFGSITEEKFAATGSGSPVAYGVLEQHYREDLSLDEAVKIAVSAIRASTLRDAASGDGVDVAIVSGSGIVEKFIPFTPTTV